MKKIAIILLALVMVLTAAGCAGKDGSNAGTGSANVYTTTVDGEEFSFDFSSLAKLENSSFTKEDFQKFADEFAEYRISKSPVSTAYADRDYGFQLEAPAEGEEIAVLHTTKGDIKMRFFPEAAPKAVENFKSLIQNGYYNGISFHRVIDGFMIQGGDPTATGRGGESVWGKSFEDEFDAKLFNLRGAVSMANSGVNTNGSQFFINQAKAETFGARSDYDLVKVYQACIESYAYNIDYIRSFGQSIEDYGVTDLKSFIAKSRGVISPLSHLIPDEVWALYEKNGGNISLDGAFRATGGHTVFAQVFDGMEAVDAIAAVEVDSSTDKPVEDMLINSAEIVTYHAE